MIVALLNVALKLENYKSKLTELSETFELVQKQLKMRETQPDENPLENVISDLKTSLKTDLETDLKSDLKPYSKQKDTPKTETDPNLLQRIKSHTSFFE